MFQFVRPDLLNKEPKSYQTIWEIYSNLHIVNSGSNFDLILGGMIPHNCHVERNYSLNKFSGEKIEKSNLVLNPTKEWG